ncbi:unnamed protein product [Blepharisma stoltei]|uniref:Uncharacterized protein n=1 Tax=Blepharisma stoltei TaxID=1481888 RepID=A0AAU9JZ72_9CILI|nr:unnamed protein product [Blepharisma stoltei]
MGVVKLHLPRNVYWRPWLPENRMWKRNGLLAAAQGFVLSYLLSSSLAHWEWASPKRGYQLVDPNADYAKPIRLL